MTVAVPIVEIPEQEKHTRGLGSLRATGKAPFPLASVSLKARVVDRVAEVNVEQKFHNPFSEPIEAVYIFPLAGGCAVIKFEMQVGARIVKGRVEERGEARRQYAAALEQGKRAALLEQERDDVFTVQVGNITPGEEITVRLVYSERLPFFEDGKTELRLPTVVAPRYVGGEELPREQAGHGVVPDSTAVPDASRITPPRLAPGFDPRVALVLEAELFGSGFAELECSQHAVRTSAGPESARVALSREREPLDRDFVLRWRLSAEKVKPSLLVHGEYAMLSLLPPAREGFLGSPRDVVFVVDRSGSMGGSKMASAARACALLLRTLGPRDRFAVQAFDNGVEWMPGGFARADEGGIERGEKWLRQIFARGGTEIDSAMSAALAEIGKVGETNVPEPGGGGTVIDARRVPVIVVLTDGEVGDESSLLKRLQTELGEARVFTVGIDTAVNDGFLKRVAAIGGGTCTFVEPGARLEEALQAVGREIGAPVITDLKISGEIDSPAPERVPDLFAGRASATFFRFKGKSVKIRGRFSDGKKYEEDVEAREAPLAAIDHLWARARVVDLEDKFRISREESVKQEIIAISIGHTVLTRFTAFVAVDEAEIAVKDKSRRTVVQPVEMPAEWAPQMLTMGAPMPAMPPPMRAMSTTSAAHATVRGAMAKMAGAFGGSGVPPTMVPRQHPAMPPEPATAEQRETVRKALEELIQAFAHAHAELKAGRLPLAQPLKEARMKTMEALKPALELATLLPLLQRFLRSAAVDIVAALSAGGATAANVLPLFERHAQSLEDARSEARGPLGAGKAPAGSFWEASI